MPASRKPGTGRSFFWEKRAFRFLQYPLLHFLVTNPVWTGLVLALLLGFAAVPIGVLKIWRSTPPGFLPRVRVSAFDLLQAWSLRRSAERAARLGQYEQADRAWRAAIRQNLGDPSLVRGGLSNLLATPSPDPRRSPEILSYTAWLLHLQGTNTADLQLVTRVLVKCERWPEIDQILRPRTDRLSDEERQYYLGALFWLGKSDEFARAWESAPEGVRSNPDLQLCRLAYLAARAAPDQARESEAQLELLLEQTPIHIPAHRADLIVRSHRMDLPGYERSLRRLEEVRADRLIDWVGQARLLEQSGRVTEARELAFQKISTTVLPWEVLDLAALLSDLGMKGSARDLLRRATARSGHSRAEWSVSLWALYGNLLIELRRWHELLDMVVTLRSFDLPYNILEGYAYFLEGRALQAQEHPELAQRCFESAARQPFPIPSLGLQTGITLLQLGYPQLAQAVLEPLEHALRDDPRYWQALVEAAFLLKKDSVTFFKAASEAYRLLPGDPLCQNNYAAALLLNRWMPEQAIPLTLEMLRRDARNPTARINHAFALTLGRRYGDAAACLADLEPVGLAEEMRTALNLAWLDINLGLDRLPEALRNSEGIDPQHLFPNQIQWVQHQQRRLSGRIQPPPPSPSQP
ncbi:MAG TPA: hypothetical protein PKM73_17100 [Verrucomicrobiota bacterium]|nr:hypothetical protein [Verrucomicrobiota bacterium]HNU52942.1 hypothetical protein [Verrucomicrobiota bacterium]